MPETDDYIFELEVPAEWALPPGKFWIGGWLLSKTEASFTDLRAFIDEVPFLGLCGMPRPEIEARYPQWAWRAHAGFACLLEPWAGAQSVRLEVLDDRGVWTEFWRGPIRVQAGAPPRPRIAVNPALLEPLLVTLLKNEARPAPAPRAELVRRLVLAAAARPLEVQPSPPFVGAFESPAEATCNTQYDRLNVLGWVLHREQLVPQILVTTDGRNENVPVRDLPRADVTAAHPALPGAKLPSFHGSIDISFRAPNPVPLRVFTEMPDGSKTLCLSKHVWQISMEEKEQPFPAYDRRRFLDVARELRRACREFHFHLDGRAWLRAARAAHACYRDGAQVRYPWSPENQTNAIALWLQRNELTPRLAELMRRDAAALAARHGPAVAFLIDATAAPAEKTARLLATLLAQIYPRWQAVAVCRPGAAPATADPRIRLVETAGSAAGALNAAAAQTGAELLAFPAADAQLSAAAALLCAEAAAAPDAPLVIYTDEDTAHDDGRREDPVCKGGWNPDAVLSGRHPGSLLVLRRTLFTQLGGFDEAAEAAFAYDLNLRLAETVRPAQVRHLAQICYHAAPAAPDSPARIEAGLKSLERALRRRRLRAVPFRSHLAARAGLAAPQPHWDGAVLRENPVTIVIPTRDHFDTLVRCIEALDRTVDWRCAQLVIVDDFTRDPKALRLLEHLKHRRDLRCRVIRPPDPRQPFNYSRLVNLGAAAAETPLVLHLNNDVDALHGGWLEEMAGWFDIPEVGAVGAKLVYPNNLINHAGLVVGPHGGLADAPLVGLPFDSLKFFDHHAIARNVSAVTGACLLTRTALYRQLGGFDEGGLGVAYNDIDYCLRLTAAGARVVYTPKAMLRHWGSASRGTAYYNEAEHVAFARRHPAVRDRFWGGAVTLQPGALALDPVQFVHTERAPRRLRVLLLTHNLNYEGAPLFLLEYARHLAGVAGFGVKIVSAEDGPLRAAFAELGLPVQIVDRHPLHGSRDRAEFAEQTRRLLAQIDVRDIDLFVCNTIVSFWGVHLAQAAGKPSLLYIHESASLARLFVHRLHPSMLGVVHDALRDASRVLFLCPATQAYYEDFNRRDNYRIISSWIELERIEEIKRAHSRADLRRRHGYADDELIIANIGTVCERKGQNIFIRAVDEFLHRCARPGERCRFLMVGGRGDLYQASLERDLARLGLPGVEIIGETRDALHYFRLADMFVCSSFEESFPRVLLEAMAFEVPVVSTDVHGVTAMVTDQAEALLVRSGDAKALARAMGRCAEQLRNGVTTVPLAYSKVVRCYDSAKVLPLHAAMAREAYLAG